MEIMHKQTAIGKGEFDSENILIGFKRILLSFIGMTIFTLAVSCSQGGGGGGQALGGVATGQGFTADMSVTLASGLTLIEGKIFITTNATRMDWKQGEANLTSISLEKENKQYLYNHDSKVYYVMNLDEEEDISNFLKSVNDYEVIEVLGIERVNGMNCTKKKVRTTIEAMGMSITSEMIIWQADGIDFPIRVEGDEGTVTQLKNVSKKTPSAKLFQPIEGYKRVNNLMEIMGFGGMGFGMGDFDDYNASDGEMDPDEIYDQVNKIMQSMLTNPDDKEQAAKIMEGARELAKEMNKAEGTASGIWSIVPQRPGDKVIKEESSRFSSEATLESNAPIGTILNHYQKHLASKGWKVDAKSIFQKNGILMMSNNGCSFSVGSEDDAKPSGQFTIVYSVSYHPDTR